MNGRASGRRELSKRGKRTSTYRRVVMANVNGRSVIAGHKARSKRRERVTRIHGAKKLLHLEPATRRRTA